MDVACRSSFVEAMVNMKRLSMRIFGLPLAKSWSVFAPLIQSARPQHDLCGSSVRAQMFTDRWHEGWQQHAAFIGSKLNRSISLRKSDDATLPLAWSSVDNDYLCQATSNDGCQTILSRFPHSQVPNVTVSPLASISHLILSGTGSDSKLKRCPCSTFGSLINESCSGWKF